MALRKLNRTNTPEATFVEGIYSQTGRSTQAEVDFLAHSVDLQQNPPKVTRRNSLQSPFPSKKKSRLKAVASAVVAGNHLAKGKQGSKQGGAAAAAQTGAGKAEASAGGDGAGAQGAEAAGTAPSSPSAAGQGRLAQQRHSTTAQGELAQAIAERLRQRRAEASSSTALVVAKPVPNLEEKRALSRERLHGQANIWSFATINMDNAPWTTKFTAAQSQGALNRWNEQRPDPGWYKVQYGMVHNKNPSWDFRERPKHPRLKIEDAGGAAPLGRSLRRSRSAETFSAPATPAGLSRAHSSGPSFLTAVDAEQEPRRPMFARGSVRGVRVASAPASPLHRHAAAAPAHGVERVMQQMALGSSRPDLGRIGRVHVLMHEVSYPAEDLHEQDIRGYHKLRYPKWDFAKTGGRVPLADAGNFSCPGKYDPNYGSVKPRTTGFVQFDKALPRSVSVTTLGYSAPEAVLHPEEKRAPGACIMDRSRAKDSIRHRITNVNDYERDLGRPPAPSYKEYHDKRDPAACESVLRNQMEYDADKADRYTTHRRDIAPSYATMIPRGRDAVQGNRGLSHDLGVRGAVGLGFVETSVQRGCNAAQRECRKSDGARERPDLGPQFEHYTTFQTTVVQNNFVHGSAPVQGSGPKYKPKPSPLRQAGNKPFERKADPGFIGRSRLGGARVPQETRTHEAMAILAGDLPDDD